MSKDWKRIVSESWGEAKTEIEKICSDELAIDEEPEGKLVSDKDIPEEKNRSEEVFENELEQTAEEEPEKPSEDEAGEKILIISIIKIIVKFYFVFFLLQFLFILYAFSMCITP